MAQVLESVTPVESSRGLWPDPALNVEKIQMRSLSFLPSKLKKKIIYCATFLHNHKKATIYKVKPFDSNLRHHHHPKK